MEKLIKELEKMEKESPELLKEWIDELAKTIPVEEIKRTLKHKKNEKLEEYNHYLEAYSLKTPGDYYFLGIFKGQLDAYKEIIEMLFGNEEDENI